MARRSGCSNLASDVILYEYPFNERIRTYLRLEHLFRRLGELVAADSALRTVCAGLTIPARYQEKCCDNIDKTFRRG